MAMEPPHNKQQEKLMGKGGKKYVTIPNNKNQQGTLWLIHMQQISYQWFPNGLNQRNKGSQHNGMD